MSAVNEQIAMSERRIAVSYEADQAEFAAKVADVLRLGTGSVILLEPYVAVQDDLSTDFDALLDRGPRLDHQYRQLRGADPDALFVIGRRVRGTDKSTIGGQQYVDVVLAAAAHNWGPVRVHRAGERACSSIVTLDAPGKTLGLPTEEIVGGVHDEIKSANDYFGSPIIDRIVALSRQDTQLMTNEQSH